MTTAGRRRKERSEPRGRRARETERVQFPIRWVGTDDLPVLMANQIFVRYLYGEVIVTFGQAVGPYELQLSDETTEQWRREGAPVRAVARVAIPPERLGRMIQALNTIYSRLETLAAEEGLAEQEE